MSQSMVRFGSNEPVPVNENDERKEWFFILINSNAVGTWNHEILIQKILF